MGFLLIAEGATQFVLERDEKDPSCIEESDVCVEPSDTLCLTDGGLLLNRGSCPIYSGDVHVWYCLPRPWDCESRARQ